MGDTKTSVSYTVLSIILSATFFFTHTLHAEVMININTADAAVLETLPGIGPAKAADIVAYRNANGPFAAKEDIKNVPGIGDVTYANIEPLITVTGTTVTEEAEAESDDPVDDSSADESSAGSDEQTGDSAENDDDNGGGSDSSDSPPHPEPHLSIRISAPERAFVNQPINFSAEPAGISDKLLDSVVISWNFGTGRTATGTEVAHAYAYAGNYVVMAYGAFAAHEAVVRHEITVLPSNFSLGKNIDGDVQVHNDAPYEIDISGYTLAGAERFTFPPRSVMLPRATITVPRERVGGLIAFLYDQQGELVARSVDEGGRGAPALVYAAAAPRNERTDTQATHVRAGSDFSFDSEVDESGAEMESMEERSKARSSPAVLAATATSERGAVPQSAYAYLGLIGVLSLGMLALYAGRSGSSGDV